jgi:multidrug efflux pump subunit AcrA (membrane-fusion protein)
MVDRLAKQGLEGFIEAALEDKDKFLSARKAELDALQDGNSRWIQAIREAQAKLDAGKPDLERIIAEEQAKINQARDSMQLRQLQQELQSAEEEETRKREQQDTIRTGLRMIRNEMNRGSDAVRQLVQSIKPVDFKIKGVTITADGKEIVQGRAMVFKIAVQHEGTVIMLEERWAPFQKPAELYRDIMKGLLKN